MTVTRQSLSNDFGRLNDEALIDLVHAGGLTELAQEVAATELRRRGLVVPAATKEPQETADTTIADDLVPIARSFSVGEAHMLRSRLEVEGVPAVVVDANIVQTNPLLSFAVGGVRVLVPESYLDQAREIAAAVARGDYTLDDKTDVG
jgi:Putative prokaryotic signal transducing protein